MSDSATERHDEQKEAKSSANRPVSRREFLMIASIAGATIGLGGGLGSLLASCGGGTSTTTGATAAATTTASGATSTASQASSTTASSGPEVGRTIKLGLVSAKTGALALFGQTDDWWIDWANRAQGDGFVCGDGKLHKFEVVVADSQSDTNRAAQVAGDLIANQKVDMILAGGGPDNVNPVADQAESLGCPSLSNMTPWQSFVYSRQSTLEKPFKWTYCQGAGVEDMTGNMVAIWDQLQTNKKVGLILANDADGQAWADETTGMPAVLKAAGYEWFLDDLFPPLMEDFTAKISYFQKSGCEIISGTLIPPDFTNFWTQAVQQRLRPKAVSIGKALLYPQALEAIGPIAYNTSSECVWHRDFPFKDSITGATCYELAADFMAKVGAQWTAPITQYAKFEWAVDAFKRTTNVDDKEDVLNAVKTTKLNTCLGLLDFTAPIDGLTTSDLNLVKRPSENVYKPPVAGQQWIKGQEYKFEAVIVSNRNHPEVEVKAKPVEMSYSS